MTQVDEEQWWPLEGRSMWPLGEPWRARVEACALAELRVGDIVAFVADTPGKLVFHRLREVRRTRQGTWLLTRGDTVERLDAPMPPEALVGRVVALELRGHRLDLGSPVVDAALRRGGIAWSLLGPTVREVALWVRDGTGTSPAALFRRARRRLGVVGIAGRALSLPLHALVELELGVHLEREATSEPPEPRPASDTIAIALFGERPSIAALDLELRALNPRWRGAAVLDVDLLAIARSPDSGRLIGYWAFRRAGDLAYDCGLFVATEIRGQALPARLFAIVVEATRGTTRRFHARADPFNRASLAALQRAGLRAVSLSVSVNLPFAGKKTFSIRSRSRR